MNDLVKHSKDYVNFCNKLSDNECVANGIQGFEFEVEDIVRSEFCKFVVEKLKIYEYSEPLVPKNIQHLSEDMWQPYIDNLTIPRNNGNGNVINY